MQLYAIRGAQPLPVFDLKSISNRGTVSTAFKLKTSAQGKQSNVAGPMYNVPLEEENTLLLE